MAVYIPKKYAAGQVPVAHEGGIVLIWALENVGKTTFAVTAGEVADLLYFANFDRDASHLLGAFKGKEYIYEEFRASNRLEAEGQLERFDGMVNHAIATRTQTKEPVVFTIDNGLIFWRVVKLAKLPPGDDVPPKAYDDANAFVEERLLRMVKGGVWVVVTSPAAEIWDGMKSKDLSGSMEVKGWNNMKYMAAAEVMMFLDTKPRGTIPVPLSQTFTYTTKAYIRTAKFRRAIEGAVVDAPTLRKIMEKTRLIREEKK